MSWISGIGAGFEFIVVGRWGRGGREDVGVDGGGRGSLIGHGCGCGGGRGDGDGDGDGGGG